MFKAIHGSASPGVPPRLLRPTRVRLTAALSFSLIALFAWAPPAHAGQRQQLEIDLVGVGTPAGGLLLEGRVHRGTAGPNQTPEEPLGVTLARNLSTLYPWRNVADTELILSIVGRDYRLRTDESGAFVLRLEPSQMPKGLRRKHITHGAIYRAGAHIAVTVAGHANGNPPTKVSGKLLLLPSKSPSDPGTFCVIDGDGTAWEAPQRNLFEKLAWPIWAALTNAHDVKPVTGVQSILRSMTAQGWPIFLVSGSPTGFRQRISQVLAQKGFPEDQMLLFLKPYNLSKLFRQPRELLRLFGPRLFTRRMKQLTDSGNFKVKRVGTLLSLLPHYNALLVGDELDTKSYAEVAKRWAGRIQAVALRQIPWRSDTSASDRHVSRLLAPRKPDPSRSCGPHSPPVPTPIVFNSYPQLARQLRRGNILRGGDGQRAGSSPTVR